MFSEPSHFLGELGGALLEGKCLLELCLGNVQFVGKAGFLLDVKGVEEKIENDEAGGEEEGEEFFFAR